MTNNVINNMISNMVNTHPSDGPLILSDREAGSTSLMKLSLLSQLPCAHGVAVETPPPHSFVGPAEFA